MISRRPLVPLLFVLIAIVALLVATGLSLRSSVAASFAQGQQIRAVRTLLFGAIEAQLNEETGVRGYAATGDPQFLQPYRTARAEMPSIFPQLEYHLSALGMPDALAAAERARQLNQSWLSRVAEPTLRLRHRNELRTARLGKALVDRFRVEAANIEVGLDRQNQLLQAAYQRDLIWLATLIALGAVLYLATGLIFAAAQARAWNRIDAERRSQQEAAMREHESVMRERSLQEAYEAEKRVADTLQEAFSQKQLPATPAIAFSATYVPATDEARVGGDWYDAFDIGNNRILFSIGDIAGHGLSASVAMSRVRNEMLSGALMDLNAQSILTRVNHRIMAQGPGAPMATAIVGIADAANYEFVYATAGHPPPVLIEPGRPARMLEFGGLPLGVSQKSTYTTRRVQTVPGARLILYTDGVIEHTRNILEGEKMLLAAVDETSTADDAAAAIYRTIFHDNSASDDVAILTIGFSANHRLGLTVSADGGNATFAGELRGMGSSPGDIASARRLLWRVAC
jgi:serine phosphatase RsbU (regulator of sigma subunit)/CHASE3 domain sensor protein